MTESSTHLRRSLGGRTWIDAQTDCEEAALLALCAQLGVSVNIGRILAARRMADADQAHRFLNPVESQLHPAELMLGMAEAVRRLYTAIERYQRVVVFGD